MGGGEKINTTYIFFAGGGEKINPPLKGGYYIFLFRRRERQPKNEPKDQPKDQPKDRPT